MNLSPSLTFEAPEKPVFDTFEPLEPRPEIDAPRHKISSDSDWMPFLGVGTEREDMAGWLLAWTLPPIVSAPLIPVVVESYDARPRRTAAEAFAVSQGRGL